MALQASGIAGEPGSVRVVELVPHYTKLLCLLNDQHISRQLSASKIYSYLRVLYSFCAAYLRLCNGMWTLQQCSAT